MIKGFRSFGVDRTGVMASNPEAGTKFDDLETWPLIQVHGLEELGNRYLLLH
jgi:hypothetical protein